MFEFLKKTSTIAIMEEIHIAYVGSIIYKQVDLTDLICFFLYTLKILYTNRPV